MTYMEALADNVVNKRMTFSDALRFLTSRCMRPEIAVDLLQDAVANAK